VAYFFEIVPGEVWRGSSLKSRSGFLSGIFNHRHNYEQGAVLTQGEMEI